MIKIDIPLFECVEHYSYNTNQDHWSRIHLHPLRFTLSKFLKRKILIKVMYNPWRVSLFQSKGKGHLRLNYYFAKPNSIQAIGWYTHNKGQTTTPGNSVPYSFQTVRRFFYVLQNCEQWRVGRRGLRFYHPCPWKLESLTICRCN